MLFRSTLFPYTTLFRSEVTAEVSAGPPSSSGTFAIYLDTVFGPADVGGRKLVIEPAPLVGADTQNTTLEPVDIRRRRHE